LDTCPSLFASVSICLLRKGGQRRSGKVGSRAPLLRLTGDYFPDEDVFDRHTPSVRFFTVFSYSLFTPRAGMAAPTMTVKRTSGRRAGGSSARSLPARTMRTAAR